MAHEADGEQDPHEAPGPAMTPSLPTAENSEIMRPVFLLPHLGQAIGTSAADIARRASKRVSHSEHLYSYSGMAFTPFPIYAAYCTAVSAHRQAMLLDQPQCTAHLCKGLHHTVEMLVGMRGHVTCAQ